MSFGRYWNDFYSPAEMRRLLYASSAGMTALALGVPELAEGLVYGYVLPKHLAGDCYAASKLVARGWSG